MAPAKSLSSCSASPRLFHATEWSGLSASARRYEAIASVGAIGRRERETEIVVKLRLAGNGLRRAREQRKRGVELAPLVQDHAEVMERRRMIGRQP